MNIDKKFVFDVKEIDKNYNFEIYNASTIGNPKNNTILFLKKNSQELLEKLKDIKNSILIILEGLDAEKLKENNLVIYDKNPRLKYALLLTEILNNNKKEYKMFFKDGYYYGENLELGEGVVIEPFVKIGNNVKIGKNTLIKSGVKIGDNVEIGENCYIRENSVIGGEGFGIEKDEEGRTFRIPHIGGVKIGNNVEIGALNTVCSGTIEPTYVGEYVKTDDHVHIAHNVNISKKCLITSGTVIAGSVKLESEVWLGVNSTIKNGVIIRKNTIVGMGARVSNNTKENEIVMNEPAQALEKVAKFTQYKKKLLKTL